MCALFLPNPRHSPLEYNKTLNKSLLNSRNIRYHRGSLATPNFKKYTVLCPLRPLTFSVYHTRLVSHRQIDEHFMRLQTALAFYVTMYTCGVCVCGTVSKHQAYFCCQSETKSKAIFSARKVSISMRHFQVVKFIWQRC